MRGSRSFRFSPVVLFLAFAAYAVPSSAEFNLGEDGRYLYSQGYPYYRNHDAPPAPFIIWRERNDTLGNEASMDSEAVTRTSMAASGHASSSDLGFGRSDFRIRFDVREPTRVRFSGTLSAIGEANPRVLAKLGSSLDDVLDVLVEVGEEEVDFVGLLEPGGYELQVLAITSISSSLDGFDGTASYDFRFRVIPEPRFGVAVGVCVAILLSSRRWRESGSI